MHGRGVSHAPAAPSLTQIRRAQKRCRSAVSAPNPIPTTTRSRCAKSMTRPQCVVTSVTSQRFCRCGCEYGIVSRPKRHEKRRLNSYPLLPLSRTPISTPSSRVQWIPITVTVRHTDVAHRTNTPRRFPPPSPGTRDGLQSSCECGDRW